MSVGGFGNGGNGTVTDGLIFSVDPYNRKSYVSGGSITYDLVNSTLSGGTLVNTPTYDVSWDFNGTNQYIDFGDVLDMGTSDYTIEAWININGVTGNDWFISKSRATVSSYRFGFGLNNNIPNSNQLYSVVVGNPATTPKTPLGVTSLTNGVWYMVTMVIDRDGDISYRIDGQPESLTGDADISAWDGQVFNSTEAFRVGTYTAADGINITNPFDGGVGPIKIYNRVLTLSESQQNYNTLKYRFR